MLTLLPTRSEKNEMTNAEYEAACITQAKVYDRFEGEHRVKQYDAKIAEIEGLLARLQEDRREIINRYDLNRGGLNKCQYCGPLIETAGGKLQCLRCGTIK